MGKYIELFSPLVKKGITKSNDTDNNKPTTPPSFLGNERRMAYANKKYHSGTI